MVIVSYLMLLIYALFFIFSKFYKWHDNQVYRLLKYLIDLRINLISSVRFHIVESNGEHLPLHHIESTHAPYIEIEKKQNLNKD